MSTSKPASPSGASARPFASPLSRAMARQHGITLTTLAGSGPHGRIVKADVLAHLAGAGQTRAVQEPADELPFDAVPNPIGRRLIARRLTESLQQIPHFQVQIDVNVDPVLQLRKQWPAAQVPRPTVNDFVIQAAGRALRAVPGVNASYTEAAIRRYRQVNVAVAVAVQDGLRTPVVRDADTLPVDAIAREMQALAAQARTAVWRRLPRRHLHGVQPRRAGGARIYRRDQPATGRDPGRGQRRSTTGGARGRARHRHHDDGDPVGRSPPYRRRIGRILAGGLSPPYGKP